VGDLAVVVSATVSQNIGQIVEVLGQQQAGTLRLEGLGHIWHVRTVSGRSSLHYLYQSGKIVAAAEGPAPDFTLVPVTGLPDVDGIAAKRKCAKVRSRPAPAAPAQLESVASDMEQRA